MRLRRGRPDEAEALAGGHAATATYACAGIFDGREFPMELTRERLHALYVLPECWGRGIGRRLLSAAGPVSQLWVLESNARGRAFYERQGWRPDGSVRTALGVRELRYRSSPPP